MVSLKQIKQDEKNRAREQQLIGELKEPLVLCVDYHVADAVICLPLEHAHAWLIGGDAEDRYNPRRASADSG